ncbi:MAG: phosphonopyruvate decarboxylase [Lachnospiraceae bacterium]|nr:phosphonopyruvate decarboxylase [Lachnospiraceae bacterium]
MRVEKLFNIIGSDFYTGVPDSLLKPLCDYLMYRYGIDKNHHIVAANEGNSVGIAAGYHLATSKIPVVYMQNSGEGNVINPLASLVNDKVYAIPIIFIIGWRGEPGVHDEPQHVYQGIVTEKLMNDMDVSTFVIGKDTSDEEVTKKMESFRKILANGKQVAFIIKKGAVEFDGEVDYSNHHSLNREEAIQRILSVTDEDPVISTTGKISRELFEIREKKGEAHDRDFLTVGSMGHCSSIALGVALNRPERKIWCIDGDGAAIMHMGAMTVIGANHPSNLVHIVINNEAHDTVGGMPTVASSVDFIELAKACGYTYAVSVENLEKLERELLGAKDRDGLSFIEIKCRTGARADLGRPTTTAIENKRCFMNFLQVGKRI